MSQQHHTLNKLLLKLQQCRLTYYLPCMTLLHLSLRYTHALSCSCKSCRLRAGCLLVHTSPRSHTLRNSCRRSSDTQPYNASDYQLPGYTYELNFRNHYNHYNFLHQQMNAYQLHTANNSGLNYQLSHKFLRRTKHNLFLLLQMCRLIYYLQRTTSLRTSLDYTSIPNLLHTALSVQTDLSSLHKNLLLLVCSSSDHYQLLHIPQVHTADM
jgi:hypothetical protein